MVLLALIIGIVVATGTNACTEFIVRGKDDSISVGRSMDFDLVSEYNFYVEPNGMLHQSIVPRSCATEGMSWKSLHKMIVLRPRKEEMHAISVDGVNNAGLTAGALYLPGYAVYQNISQERCDHAISQKQVVSYILGIYGNVDQLKEDILSNKFPLVWGDEFIGMIPPVHFSVTDKTGAAIVIEYTAEGRKVYDNIIGVMTNSPTYDWHMTNVKHYVHLSNKRHPARRYHDGKGKEHVIPEFAASGLLGLPGDYTSPSRFVRAAAMLHLSNVPNTSEEAIVTAFHILSSVELTAGVVQGRPLGEKTIRAYTLWQFVKDLTNGCIYYRTYDYISIRKLCLSSVTLQHGVLPLDGEFKRAVQDVSGKVESLKTTVNEM